MSQNQLQNYSLNLFACAINNQRAEICHTAVQPGRAGPGQDPAAKLQQKATLGRRCYSEIRTKKTGRDEVRKKGYSYGIRNTKILIMVLNLKNMSSPINARTNWVGNREIMYEDRLSESLLSRS